MELPASAQSREFTCGPAALQQILALKGKKFNNQEVLALLNIQPGENSDMPSIALALAQQAINFDFYVDLRKILPEIPSTNKGVVLKLEELAQSDLPLKKLIFVKKLQELHRLLLNNPNQNFISKTITEQEIISSVNNSNPVIVVVDSTIFGENASGQHIAIMTGYNFNSFIFIGKKPFLKSKEVVIGSILAAKVPSLLVIKNAD